MRVALEALLVHASALGLVPRAEVERLLAWTDEVKRRLTAGELASDEVARLLESNMADAMRRGDLEGWGAALRSTTLDDLYPPKRGDG
jgi:hypothetical protein